MLLAQEVGIEISAWCWTTTQADTCATHALSKLQGTKDLDALTRQLSQTETGNGIEQQEAKLQGVHSNCVSICKTQRTLRVFADLNFPYWHTPTVKSTSIEFHIRGCPAAPGMTRQPDSIWRTRASSGRAAQVFARARHFSATSNG